MPGLEAVSLQNYNAKSFSTTSGVLFSFLNPFDAAGVALPVVFAYGNRNGQKQPQTVSPEAIDFFKSNIERITTRTPRLLVQLANFFLVELRRDRFVQNSASGLGILLVHLQANAADGVREQPVHADQVAISQGAGNSSRLQLSLGQQGLGDIAEMLQRDEFGRHFRLTPNRDKTIPRRYSMAP